MLQGPIRGFHLYPKAQFALLVADVKDRPERITKVGQ
jgi:hypothetical protein